MKKVLVTMLAAVLVLALTACGGFGSDLNGTFLDETGSVSLTFSGDKVTLAFPKNNYSTEGTFKTADGILTLQFKEDTNISAKPVPYKFDGKDLIIEGKKYKRQ